MKKFNIYSHELLQPEIVKDGWSWPAFFFNFIWALIKKLWAVFIISFILWAITLAILFTSTSSYESFDIMTGIAGFVFQLVYGFQGNKWRVEKLSKLGYKHVDTISAKSHKLALAQYKTSLGEKELLSPEKTKSPEPESKPETNKSTGSIVMTTKKNEDEKSTKQYTQDGIIFKSKKDWEEYNQMSYPVSKPVTVSEEKTQSDSNNQSEYINKLKEAKALLDDELINQDDYEKIKQKIIDNM